MKSPLFDPFVEGSSVKISDVVDEIEKIKKNKKKEKKEKCKTPGQAKEESEMAENDEWSECLGNTLESMLSIATHIKNDIVSKRGEEFPSERGYENVPNAWVSYYFSSRL